MGKTDNLEFLDTNLAKNRFRVGNSENYCGNKSILEIPCALIFRQNGPNLPQNWFCDPNSKKLSPDSESATSRYHVSQFSVKTDNFEFFGLNLGKLPNYMRYFGSNNVEDVAKSRIEVEIRWVEVGGAGWRCVHGLSITGTKCIFSYIHFSHVLFLHFFLQHKCAIGTEK